MPRPAAHRTITVKHVLKCRNKARAQSSTGVNFTRAKDPPRITHSMANVPDLKALSENGSLKELQAPPTPPAEPVAPSSDTKASANRHTRAPLSLAITSPSFQPDSSYTTPLTPPQTPQRHRRPSPFSNLCADVDADPSTPLDLIPDSPTSPTSSLFSPQTSLPPRRAGRDFAEPPAHPYHAPPHFDPDDYRRRALSAPSDTSEDACAAQDAPRDPPWTALGAEDKSPWAACLQCQLRGLQCDMRHPRCSWCCRRQDARGMLLSGVSAPRNGSGLRPAAGWPRDTKDGEEEAEPCLTQASAGGGWEDAGPSLA